MTEQTIRLETWARSRWGDEAPSIKTLRRWVREARIFPIPQKVGRSYFVRPNAEYIRDYNDSKLVSRIRDAQKTQ